MIGLHISGSRFTDHKGRQVIIHGINLAGDSKCPARPDIPSHQPDHFFQGDSVSFVGRPFTLDDAPRHFARLRKYGFNTLRYIFTWEALEHAGPGVYDEEYIDYTIEVLKLARQYGFYVFMDPHQDVWSRFSGGSGAPMWTLYACGFNPRTFAATKAALVHNTHPDPAEYPRMIWPTNYYRLVSQTMFALFFAGSYYAPKARIDDQNIQHYLQGHFIRACKHLADRLSGAGLCGSVVVGWESMNEPNKGFIGYPDLTQYPPDQRLKLGPSPSGWQGMLLGMGRPVDVPVWKFGWLGPAKSGSEHQDPSGALAWLSPGAEEDIRYGWTRDPGWRLGECIWAQHGVWRVGPDHHSDQLLRSDYFATGPDGKEMTYDVFTNTFFMDFYRAYRAAIRQVLPDTMMFCQPPVFEIPPDLVHVRPDGSKPDDEPDTIFAPHFYDGMTLMNKSWNRFMNVDVLGVLRGRYPFIPLATRFGETAIRACLRDQLRAMTDEGSTYMGPRPTVFTEIGIPYDMNGKAAYSTGNYSDQIAAMDANMFALEGSGASGYTLWTYVATNCHEWGDCWNGEDLSIYSLDDPLPGEMVGGELCQSGGASPKKGHRAAEAFVRPYPVAARGDILSHGFNLQACTWKMTVAAPEPGMPPTPLDDPDSSKSSLDTIPNRDPTLVFLPELHFPSNRTAVEVTGGDWTIVEPKNPTELRQLQWFNPDGEHTITIVGKTTWTSSASGSSTPASGTEECGQCQVM